jgi:glycosyltransferase involved in cell wall biosynthesis
MRVCFLSGNIFPILAKRAAGDLPIIGGAETQQFSLAMELRRRGVSVSFITEDYGQGAETEANGFPISAYTFGRDKITQGRTLIRAMGRRRPDLFYVRGVPRFIGLIAFHARLRRIPLVIGMATNRTVHPRPLNAFSMIEDAAYRWSLAHAAAVVAQTGFQRTMLAKHYRCTRAVVIRNGARPSAEPLRDRAERERVVWIATLHPHKGIERLFALASMRPVIRIDVVSAPERGSEAYYEEMMERAAALPNVRWLGTLPHDEIDKVLSRSLALIHTTLPHPGTLANLHEGFPNVYLEAWRNGTPVVTLDTDPDGMIEEGGLGFHSRTIERMAEDVDRIVADVAAWRRMSEAARIVFERDYRIEKAAEDYIQLFRGILGEREGGGRLAS